MLRINFLAILLLTSLSHAQPAPATRPTYKLDFGPGAAAAGWQKATTQPFTSERGFGWIDADRASLKPLDRKRADSLRGDFVQGRAKATLRFRVTPGIYRIAVISGDMNAGGHELRITANVSGVEFPPLKPRQLQFLTLTSAIDVQEDQLDLVFDSPRNDWIVNAVLVAPAERIEAPRIIKDIADPDQAPPLRWQTIDQWPDPTKEHLERFRQNVLHDKPQVAPIPLASDDYLKLITSVIDFWRKQQNDDGAIIDPYKNEEWQYSTPCFAHAAACLATSSSRDDLIEPAAKAVDWCTLRLGQHKAATGHSDFYGPPIVHAMRLLKPKVPHERYAQWEKNLRFDPYGMYAMGLGTMNWNVVALAGEFLMHDIAVRDNFDFVEDSLAAQEHQFIHPWGMYTEGPMVYDAWPRVFLGDMIAHGYNGQYAPCLTEILRRGALASLLMQSPTGEMVTGGRSSHHIWNEAQQCALFEIAAARAKAKGDALLASSFKRAAALSLNSMRRWIRPSGEFQVLKNWVDPKERFGFEWYSAQSQYNLIACTMLMLAHEHALKTQDVAAGVAPADVGGFVLDLRQNFNKIIANAGGTYVHIEVGGDPEFNPTGLIRVHRNGVLPQIGPSDGVTAKAQSSYPKNAPRTTAAIGLAWRDATGAFKRLAEFDRRQIKSSELQVDESTPQRVSFAVHYRADFGPQGPSEIIEKYLVTPGRVEQTTQAVGYDGPLQLVFPVLASDGKDRTNVSVRGNCVQLEFHGSRQTFNAPDAQKLTLQDPLCPHRNGWIRLGVADFPAGAHHVRLVLTPSAD